MRPRPPTFAMPHRSVGHGIIVVMRPNLTASLIDSLRQAITSGKIPPGDKLPSESELIAQHKVSRTVVREAISHLQAEGLVHTRKGVGSFVLTPPAPPSEQRSQRIPRTLAERRALIEFRLAVEVESAALAATRRSIADLEAIDDALRRFESSAANASQAMRFDYEFHRCVARASNNSYFCDAVDSFGPLMIAMPRQRLSGDSEDSANRIAVALAEHVAIRTAIVERDPLRATAAMRMHLSNSIARLEAQSGMTPKALQ